MAEELYNIMCRESEKLQEAWKPKIGDRTNKGIILKFTGTIEHPSFWTTQGTTIREEYVWLPRQEDLQELFMKEEKLSAWTMQCLFRQCFLMDINKQFIELELTKEYSFDIIWLLFVHKELWNQTWSFENKKWVGV